MTNEEIESCIQTLRFLENTFLDDHGIFLNDKHPDNIEKIIIFLHESSVTPNGVTVTDFADRCRECGAEYEKLLEASKPFINKPCVSEGTCREDKMQVLDKIREEIMKLKHDVDIIMYGIAIDDALKIIDKYRTESEDK